MNSLTFPAKKFSYNSKQIFHYRRIIAINLSTSLKLSTLAISTILLASTAQASGRLVIYCSTTNELCETETQAFSKNMMLKLHSFVTAPVALLLKLKRKKITLKLMFGMEVLSILNPKLGN